jgi:hypothetical protein
MHNEVVINRNYNKKKAVKFDSIWRCEFGFSSKVVRENPGFACLPAFIPVFWNTGPGDTTVRVGIEVKIKEKYLRV